MIAEEKIKSIVLTSQDDIILVFFFNKMPFQLYSNKPFKRLVGNNYIYCIAMIVFNRSKRK